MYDDGRYDISTSIKVAGLVLAGLVLALGFGLVGASEDGLAQVAMLLLVWPILFVTWIVGEALGGSVNHSLRESQEWMEADPLLRIIVGVFFGLLLGALGFAVPWFLG